MAERTFNSIGQIQQTYFPKTYKRKQREREIKEKGLGKYLAEQILKEIKNKLSRA